MLQENKLIQIQTREGTMFMINWNLFRFHSKMFDKLNEDDFENQKPFVLEITADIFKKIEAYLIKQGQNQFELVPRPIPSAVYANFLNARDTSFLNQFKDGEYQIISKAANYLGIQHMSDLVNCAIACLFIGITANETAQQYGITEDYTLQIEEQLKKDFHQYFQGTNIQGD